MFQWRKKGCVCVALALAMVLALASCTPRSSVDSKGDATMIFKEYYISVKDFGALGDGKNDDTAAIEAACKSASDGGVIYFPKGTYVIARDLMIPNKFDMAFDKGAVLSLQENVMLRAFGELIAGQYKIFEFGQGAELGGNFSGSGYPQWFGAVGDGVTDDSAAFQRAIDLFREVCVPVTEKGYVVSELTLREGTRLQGESTADGTRPLLLSTAECKHMINIRTGNIRIQELAFDMKNAPDSASMVHFQTSLGWIGFFYINHISMMNVPTGFTDDGTGHALMNMYFENWDVVAPRGPVVDMKDIEGFFFMRHVNVDMTASSKPEGFPAIRIATIIGGVFEDVHVLGRGIDTREKGWEMPQCTSVWYQDCSVRNTGGYGMTFATQGYYLTFTDVTVENCQGGIWLKDTMFLQMSDLHLTGAEGTAADGLRLGNVHQGQIIGLEASGFTNGLRVDTGSYNYISQAKLSGNTSYGVNAMGSHNVLAGVICHGNGNDEIRLSGSDNELLAESLPRPDEDIGQGDFVPYLPTQTEASLPEVSGKVTMLAHGEDLAQAVAAGHTVIGLTSGAYELNEDLVIPQQTMLVVNRGAWIKIADGCTLTLDNAPVRAGQFHIFRGDGTVTGRTAFGYPQWFGVVGNLRTDDTAAMQTAVNVCRTLEVPYGSGAYQISTVVVSHPLTLVGTGAARINFNPMENTQRLFEIRSSDVEFRNVAVKALSMKDPHSAVFYFGTEKDVLENIYFENVYVTNAWGALRDANGNGEVKNASFYELSCIGDRSTSVLLHDFTENIMFSQTVITRGDTPALGISIDFPGMVIENAKGIFLKDLDIAFDLESGPGGHGLILRHCKDVRLSRMLMEHLSGYGFIFEDCENISLYNPVTFGTEYGGALFKNVRGGYIDLMKCVGSDNWSERLLEYEGIVFENCEDLTVYGLKSYAYRDTALVLRGCKNIHIEGYTALDNWAGELETENCENCTVSAQLYSNNHKKK